MFQSLYRGGQLRYQGQCLSLWDSYGLANYEMRSGAFSEDARGRWYLNVTVDVKKPALAPASERSQFAALQSSAVGVDLGLKDLLALSNGEKVPSQQFYRDLESPLAAAQRAGHKQRVKTIHAKIDNRRKDHLHKLSTRLVRDHGAIFIGNVSACQLTKTRMAKSVLNAGIVHAGFPAAVQRS